MPSDDILTTVQAAKLLHCSRQHVVHLCETGRLSHVKVGRYRRLRREDVERFLDPEMRREDERSFWINVALAAKLVQDPDGVIERAKERLQFLREVHSDGRSGVYMDGWQAALDEGPHAVLEIMTSRTGWGQAMRSSSPVSGLGLLTDDERNQVLSSFRSYWTSQHRKAA
jgi:excisionase family DNA binding protein